MLRTGLLIAAAILIAMIAGAVFLEVPKYYRLSRSGRETIGKVVSKEREKHNTINLQYSVEGRTFESGGFAEAVGRSFDTLSVGDQVVIYYDPDDPGKSTLGDPVGYLKTSLRGTLFISFIPLLAYISYKVKTRSKRRKGNA